MSDIKKVVLAYSGGLDTSVILKWLQDNYHCEIVTFTADLGQGEELEPARAKALKFGINPKNIYIDDLREEFVRDFVFPMFRANTVYEGEYLLGTSIARPLIAKRLIDIARETGADTISHGATGKGNDQVRFELGAYALMPNVKIIAPWREWDLLSREKLLKYAEDAGIDIDMKHKKGGAPYSMDANLLHISFEGRHLENPGAEAEEAMWRWTVSPEAAPDAAEYLDVEFEHGDIVALNGKQLSPAAVLTELNRLGGKHGIGRLDLVENRYVGMKSRGCYETPGGTIMLRAHRAIESITLDRHVQFTARLLELPLGEDCRGRNDAGTVSNFHTGWQNVSVPDVRTRSPRLLIQQILKLNFGSLESIRIGIRKIVCDIIKIELLGFHPSGACVQRLNHI